MDIPYKLYKGDCLEIMPTLEAGSVDAIITDLPYGTTACAWDEVIPFAEMWREVKRVLKPNGAFITTANQPFTSALIMSRVDLFREEITWIKHKPSNIGNGKYMHLKYTEGILIFSDGTPTYNPQFQKRESDRVKQAQKGNSKNWRTNRKETQEVSFATQYKPREWSVYDADVKLPMNYMQLPSVVSNSDEKCDHPTQKPVALYRYLIRTYTNESETVLDITMGSGTTGVAAWMEGRKFIGIERDPKYFAIAEKRISQAAQQPALFHATQQSMHPTRAGVPKKFDNF
jgi:site-specific DNA-methyltransferase (adenine-specific)